MTVYFSKFFPKESLLNTINEILQIDPETVNEALRREIDSVKETTSARIKAAPKTYDQFVLSLVEAETHYNRLSTALFNLKSLATNDAVEKACEAALIDSAAFGAWKREKVAIYESYKAVLEQDKTLNDAQRKAVENTVRVFELNGVHLPKAEKKQLKRLNEKLSLLSQKFSANVLRDVDTWTWEVDESALEGVPEADLSRMRRENGRCVLTLRAPDVKAVLEQCRERKTRRHLYEAHLKRGRGNKRIARSILARRMEKANLLGFNNWADLSFERDKAADSPRDALSLCERLVDAAQPFAQKENARIDARALVDGIKNPRPWDRPFYAKRIEEEEYAIDESRIREYLQSESVLEGLFRFIEELTDVRFEPVETPLWHTDAQAFNLIHDGNPVGRLIVDLFARKGKRGGAWMNDLEPRMRLSDGTLSLPVALISCNFPEKDANGRAFLTHRDVVTLFHETGHALHHLLSEVETAGVSGIDGVDWDMVELPSQFFENFAYERDVLQTFARHVDTQAPLRDEDIDALERARTFSAARALLRQNEFAMFDLQIHLSPEKGLDETLAAVRERVGREDALKIDRIYPSFGHIFAGGYDAGYYSYKWAELYSADAFVRFRGLAGEERKKRFTMFREHVIAIGGVKPLTETYRAFSGEDPTVENYLAFEGMVENTPA